MSAGAPSRMQARMDEIIRLVRTDGTVEVSSLADRFDVTTETIRRDLNDLQERRLVKRVHGGAVPWDTQRFEPDMVARESQGVELKRRIALAAVAALPLEGTLLMDSGSTVRLVADYLPGDSALHVVTNSLLHAHSLAALPDVDVFLIGGHVNERQAVTDAGAVEMLRTLKVDTALMGADGVDPVAGFTTPYHDEHLVKRAVLEAATRVVLLADSRKHGEVFMRRFATWDEVDTYVTDGDGDPAMLDAIRAMGTDVVVA